MRTSTYAHCLGWEPLGVSLQHDGMICLHVGELNLFLSRDQLVLLGAKIQAYLSPPAPGCEHDWHRFGTVNGEPDYGCQKCGATRRE